MVFKLTFNKNMHRYVITYDVYNEGLRFEEEIDSFYNGGYKQLIGGNYLRVWDDGKIRKNSEDFFTLNQKGFEKIEHIIKKFFPKNTFIPVEYR